MKSLNRTRRNWRTPTVIWPWWRWSQCLPSVSSLLLVIHDFWKCIYIFFHLDQLLFFKAIAFRPSVCPKLKISLPSAELIAPLRSFFYDFHNQYHWFQKIAASLNFLKEYFINSASVRMSDVTVSSLSAFCSSEHFIFL